MTEFWNPTGLRAKSAPFWEIRGYHTHVSRTGALLAIEHNGWDHAPKVTAEGTGLVGHAGASLSEVSRVQGPQRLPVAGFRVRVVDGVVRHRESVARGVELHGVVDARLGERVLQQFGLLRGEVLVLLSARYVNGGGDLVRSEVRARGIAGDGDPAAVERRRG